MIIDSSDLVKHSHVYLSADHSSNEWRTYSVICICLASMVIEISCGVLYACKYDYDSEEEDVAHDSGHDETFNITVSQKFSIGSYIMIKVMV